jgi:phage terminase large subunit-like protein
MAKPGRWMAVVGFPMNDYIAKNMGVVYDASKQRISWPNGSWATWYSADEPERLRGFSGDTVLVNIFKDFDRCWPHIQFGLRDVPRPHVFVTERLLIDAGNPFMSEDQMDVEDGARAPHMTKPDPNRSSTG